MKEELKKFKITEKECLDRKEYRNKIFELKVLVVARKIATEENGLQQRRAEQSKRTKDF